MDLTIESMYEVRFGPSIPLPKKVQDLIAKLRITPIEYNKPKSKHIPASKSTWKKFGQPKKPEDDNWRINVLKEAVSAINLKTQTNYNENYYAIVGLLNKVVMSNVSEFSDEIISKLQGEDDTVRMRVTTFLFNKAITENTYANLMAECVVSIAKKIPELYDDIICQIQQFPIIYNTSQSLMFPSNDDPEFQEKVFAYFKQKEKKRGYAKFMMELLVRGFVGEEMILKSIDDVLEDIHETARKPACSQTEENLIVLTTFLFETIKILPSNSNKLICNTICSFCEKIIKLSSVEIPSLTKRCKFKLMDTLDERVKKDKEQR